MENVVSWNKRVRGGDSCQLEQKGMGWLSAGTKSEGTVVPETCHLLFLRLGQEQGRSYCGSCYNMGW